MARRRKMQAQVPDTLGIDVAQTSVCVFDAARICDGHRLKSVPRGPDTDESLDGTGELKGSRSCVIRVSHHYHNLRAGCYSPARLLALQLM